MEITSFAKAFEMLETEYKERTAFQYVTGNCVQEISYEKFISDVRCCCRFLQDALTEVKEKHIGVLAENEYETIVCHYGILLSGAVLVPIHSAESLESIRYEINHADLAGLFMGITFASEPVKKNVTDKFPIWELDDFRKIKTPEVTKIETAVTEHPAQTATEHPAQTAAGHPDQNFRFKEANPGQPAMIIYTSGTTGKPKGVMLSHRNCLTPLCFFIQAVRTTTNMPTARVYLILPLYHISSISGVMTWLMTGATLNICSSMKYLYRDLSLMPSDHASIVPMIQDLWYKDLKKNRANKLGGLTNLTCGGAPVNSYVFHEFEKHGIHMSQAYGMTEIFGGITMNHMTHPAKLRSVGTSVFGNEIAIKDGEVCVKSDAVMMGYYKDEQATNEALQDGWLHTGDLGYFDKDGYLYLTGRKKNLIILPSGENVSPEMLEEKLSAIPEVTEVMVRETDQKIEAVMYSEAVNNAEMQIGRQPQNQDPKSLKEQIEAAVTEINRTLPAFAKIAIVTFTDAPFPRNASGKRIRRKDI